MGGKTTVAFRIDESVKAEWEQAAEDPEYNSLSHLIRLAVQREIADTGRSPPESQNPSEPERVAQLQDSLTRLEGTVEDIYDEMEVVAREQRAEELYDMEQVLLELLPTASESLDPVQELDPEELESGGMTPREIAGRIGADTSDVADAVKRLEEKTAQVQSVTNRKTEETFYWKSE